MGLPFFILFIVLVVLIIKYPDESDKAYKRLFNRFNLRDYEKEVLNILKNSLTEKENRILNIQLSKFNILLRFNKSKNVVFAYGSWTKIIQFSKEELFPLDAEQIKIARIKQKGMNTQKNNYCSIILDEGSLYELQFTENPKNFYGKNREIETSSVEKYYNLMEKYIPKTKEIPKLFSGFLNECKKNCKISNLKPPLIEEERKKILKNKFDINLPEDYL